MGNIDTGAQTLQASEAGPVKLDESAADPEPAMRSQGMDGVQSFLDELRRQGLVEGNFLGLIHVLIGRRITRPDGSVVSPGLTWRQLADIFKSLRWSKEAIREIGLNPANLPPRDRQRFWYTAIAQAKVDSPETLARFRELVEGGLEPKAIVRELKAVGGDLKALRLALTGHERGPELAAVIAALPRDELLSRLER